MQLAGVAKSVISRWPTVLIFTIIGSALGYGVSAVLPPTYTAESNLLVSIKPIDEATVLTTHDIRLYTVRAAKNYSALASSATVLEPVSETIDSSRTVEQIANSLESFVVGSTIIHLEVKDDTLASARQTVAAVGQELTLLMSEPGRIAPNVVVSTDVVDAAPTTGSVSPNVGLNAAVGFLLGLFAGLAWTAVKGPIRGGTHRSQGSVHRRRESSKLSTRKESDPAQ